MQHFFPAIGVKGRHFCVKRVPFGVKGGHFA